MKRLMLLLLAVSTVLCMSACIGETTPSDVSVKPDESSAVSDSVSSDVSKAESDAIAENSSENVSSETVSDEASDDHSHNHGDEASSQKPEENPTAPIKMVGTWKRVSVETEGDVNGGGNCTVVITGTSESNLKISYTDKNFPSENYSDKTIDLTEQKYFELFGNGDWCGVVNHFGPNDTTYCLALFEGDVLKIKSFFELDGTLASSIQVFERVK